MILAENTWKLTIYVHAAFNAGTVVAERTTKYGVKLVHPLLRRRLWSWLPLPHPSKSLSYYISKQVHNQSQKFKTFISIANICQGITTQILTTISHTSAASISFKQIQYSTLKNMLTAKWRNIVLLRRESRYAAYAMLNPEAIQRKTCTFSSRKKDIHNTKIITNNTATKQNPSNIIQANKLPVNCVEKITPIWSFKQFEKKNSK